MKIPTYLETGWAGELLSTDFGQYGRSNLLIVKDRYSGLLRVYLTHDKTIQAAISGVTKWMHMYRIPKEIRSDQGPCYGKEFSESGAKQLALDTACQLHIIAKVTDVQKEESDRLKISWRRWGESECLTRMSSTNWFLS